MEIVVLRHLKDYDDLRKYGRDADLIPNQDLIAKHLALQVRDVCAIEGVEGIKVITSPMKRAVQTGELITDHLEDLVNDMFADGGLSGIYQGEFLLPRSYVPGGRFRPLELANKVFIREVYGAKSDNHNYCFGDHVSRSGSVYKCLKKYFTKCGESNHSFLLRVYDSIRRIVAESLLQNSVVSVVVTHAQIYQILRDLVDISMEISNGYQLCEGGLPRLCWEKYQHRFKNFKISYDPVFKIDDCVAYNLIGLLNKEIKYLKKWV